MNTSNRHRQRRTRSPAETRALAAEWLALWPATRTQVLALTGELGSGKTCFVQGLAGALGVDQAVTSPTYTLVNEYRGRDRRLIHVDWYRLDDAADADNLGLDDLPSGPLLIAIEWPQRARWWLPDDTVEIIFREGDAPTERIIVCQPALSGAPAS